MILRDRATRLYRYRCLTAAMEAFSHGQFDSSEAEDSIGRNALWYDSTNDMEYYYRKHMPLAMGDLSAQMLRPQFPLVAALVGNKAVAFREDVSIDLVDPGNDYLPLDRKTDGFDPERLPDILQRYGIMDALQRADELSVAHNMAVVWFRILEDGTLWPEALPPYCAEIVANRSAPANIAIAPEIYIPETGDAYPEDGTGDEIYYTYAYRNGGYYCYLKHGSSGEEIAAPGPENGPPIPILPQEVVGANSSGLDPRALRVQAPPVVVWKEVDNANAYAPTKRQLLRSQVEVNTTLVDVALAFMQGAAGQIVLEQIEREVDHGGGMVSLGIGDTSTETDVDDPGAKVIEVSRSRHMPLVLQHGWSAKLIQPTMDVYAFTKYVEAKIRLAFVAEGLNANTVTLSSQGLPSNYSAAAKLVDASPSELDKQRREKRLARHTIRTLNAWRKWHNITCPEADRIPEEYEWGVRFGNLWHPSILTNQSAMQSVREAVDLGLANPVEINRSISGGGWTSAGRRWARNTGIAASSKRRLSEPTTPAPTE